MGRRGSDCGRTYIFRLWDCAELTTELGGIRYRSDLEHSPRQAMATSRQCEAVMASGAPSCSMPLTCVAELGRSASQVKLALRDRIEATESLQRSGTGVVPVNAMQA